VVEGIIKVGDADIEIDEVIREDSKLNIILAHGSNVDMRYSLLQKLFDALSSRYSTLRFNFSFFGGTDEQKMNFEKSKAELEACIKYMGSKNIVIVGKSLGGYIGTLLAGRKDLGVKGVISMGYPMHEMNRPKDIRHEFSHAHLEGKALPVEFIIGDSDPMWKINEAPPIFANYPIHIVQNADHSYNPIKPSTTKDENEDEVVGLVQQIVAKFESR
jgi:predicted alpha/beta-hydrolase family hydrolase